MIGSEITRHILHQSKQKAKQCLHRVYHSLRYDWLIILTQSARIGQHYKKNLHLRQNFSRDFYGNFSSGILNGWMIGLGRFIAHQLKSREWSKGICDLDPTLSLLIFVGSVRSANTSPSFIILFFFLVYSIWSMRTRHVWYHSQLIAYRSKCRELKTTSKDHKNLSPTLLLK